MIRLRFIVLYARLATACTCQSQPLCTVCRLNMSHGDHDSHQEVVEKIRNYNKLDRGCVAILLDTKVRNMHRTTKP